MTAEAGSFRDSGNGVMILSIWTVHASEATVALQPFSQVHGMGGRPDNARHNAVGGSGLRSTYTQPECIEYI